MKTISVLNLANLFDYATYHGISEQMLRTYLIDENLDVCNEEGMVSEKEFLAVLEKMIVESKHTHFGLHFGCFLNMTALGFIVKLSLNASSIEQAVFVLQQYLAHSLPVVSLKVEEVADNYILRLESEIEDELLKSNLLDIVICFIYRELKLMLDSEDALQLRLPYSDLEIYRQLLKTDVVQKEEYAVVMNKKVLKKSINLSRVKQIEYLLPQFMIMITSEAKGDFSLKVRNMMLKLCAPELPSFEALSSQFPLSDRTIQRKLTLEGTSFRKISNEIKQELSDYLEKGKFMKKQDIAHILGYSETSGYLHAMRKW